MCGRFGIVVHEEDLVDRYNVESKPPEYSPSYNVTPSNYVPVVIKNEQNEIHLMKWGFLPSWADPDKFKLRPINTRDDALNKPLFKKAFSSSRCLIPANFFYEWKKTQIDGKDTKEPFCIKVKKEKIFSFAGLYSQRKDSEGINYFTFTLITTKPNSIVAKIHDRMPLILQKEDEDKWIDNKTSKEKLISLIMPFPSDMTIAWQVSPSVNSPINDGKDLIKPLKI